VVTGSDTETSDVVVDDTDSQPYSMSHIDDLPPDQGVSVVWSGKHSIDGQGRGDSNSQERDPLDVVDQVSPGHWRQVLLLGNSS
jgi:hypothetical protein